MMLVTMTPLPEEHKNFGHPLKDTSKLVSAHISMVAVTGCQSTIIPLRAAYTMGIRKDDPIPVPSS
jgi:hypothetical protein